MQTSANFHSSNQILFKAPILKQTEASRDYSAGWGDPHSTGPVDVIDLNQNGKADFVAQENRDTEVYTVKLEEPAIVSPTLDRLEAFAKKSQTEVLTQDDLPQGVFSASVQCSGKENSQQVSQGALSPLNALVNDMPQEFDPQAKYAIDFAKGEFLVYKPA
jgi:hypothetical protein